MVKLTLNLTSFKIFVGITYLGMVIVNVLANVLPINGTTTGDVSNSYPNLFAPAAVTFSIWGVIYLLLAAHTLYQFGFFQKNISNNNHQLLRRIGTYFGITSIANMLWILSWHYHLIGLSLLLMLVILFFLIKIASLFKNKELSTKEKFFIQIPFSIYFGWITVASIANITTFFVSLNWNGWGLSDQVWMIIVLSIGAAIGILTAYKNKNVFYGLVLIWAYFGIWVKHTSLTGFNSQYPAVINTTIACLILFLITNGLVVFKKEKS